MQGSCDIRTVGNGWYCATCGGAGVGPEPTSCVADDEHYDPPLGLLGGGALAGVAIASIALMIWALRLAWGWLKPWIERLASLVYLIGGWAP